MAGSCDKVGSRAGLKEIRVYMGKRDTFPTRYDRQRSIIQNIFYVFLKKE